MDFAAMNMFLSEDNMKKHLDYLHTLEARLSIILKSIPSSEGRDIDRALCGRLDRKTKDEIKLLLWHVRSHKCFFDSFSTKPANNIPELKKQKLLYDIFLAAKGADYGYLYILGDRSRPIIKLCNDYDGAFVDYHPFLAIDLYEHVYFADYGFAGEKFLRNALAYLDLSKLP